MIVFVIVMLMYVCTHARMRHKSRRRFFFLVVDCVRPY